MLPRESYVKNVINTRTDRKKEKCNKHIGKCDMLQKLLLFGWSKPDVTTVYRHCVCAMLNIVQHNGNPSCLWWHLWKRICTFIKTSLHLMLQSQFRECNLIMCNMTGMITKLDIQIHSVDGVRHDNILHITLQCIIVTFPSLHRNYSRAPQTRTMKQMNRLSSIKNDGCLEV